MSVVKREDGIKFAIHTYREILLSQRASKIKEQIRRLAHDHGEYVRFFRKSDEQIEAIFSKEPGFLLAESVWRYFNCPSDLVYCEVLPDNVNALLIVIQRDIVYLDAKLLLSDIPDELSSFMTGDNQYQVYTYGNPPISDEFESGKFTIPKEDLSGFAKLQESVFEKLPVDENLQLQPLNLALRTQKLGKSSPVWWLAGLGILLVFAFVWWFWSSRQPSTVVSVQRPVEKPFSTYKNVLLESPNLTQLFEEFSNLLAFSSSLPGWRISHIEYKSGGYVVDVKPQGQLSSLQMLEKWLKRFGLKFVLKKDGIQFSVNSKALKRQTVPEVQNLDQVSLMIIDKLKSMVPMGADIQIENEGRKHGLVRSLEIKINFSSTSPDVLILLGRELLQLPVLIKEINLSMDNNLLSGSLELTVLGK